jgi:hypothetical protein
LTWQASCPKAAEASHRRHLALALFASGHSTHALHHLLHLAKLLDQTVHLGN